MMEVDIRSDHSCFFTIGDYTIYIELSEATDNKLYLTYCMEDWEDDRVVTITGGSSTR